MPRRTAASLESAPMNKPSNETPSAADLAFKRTMDFDYGVAHEVAPGVRRVVANNPSPFTFKGTNTFILGDRNVAVMDPGPDDDAHLEAVMNAVGSATVTHILLTHTHRDHSDGIDALKARTGAPVYAYGKTGKPRGAGPASLTGKAFVDESFEPEEKVRDGDTIQGDGWALDAIYTPGHAPDHLCFALVGERLVFSGDHVMGWNTTVVAPPEGNMGDYMASLEKLLERRDKLFFPAHGGRIETPQRVVKAYLMHRKWREAAIYACLEDGMRTNSQIVGKIYPGLDASLLAAASLSVHAHLEHLIQKGSVTSADETPGIQSSYAPVPADAQEQPGASPPRP